MTDFTYTAEIVALVPTGISRALHAFLTDWLAWVDAGAPERHFYRSGGLCFNARQWACSNDTIEYDAYDVQEDLYDLFGGNLYPFGRGEFHERSRQCTQHEDPNRLAWVRAVLAANPVKEG